MDPTTSFQAAPQDTLAAAPNSPAPSKSLLALKSRLKSHLTHLSTTHSRTPYLRRIPLPALLIILLILTLNLVIWALVALILSSTHSTALLATAALSYTLGLRHALDADHISAIDLMTRRLLASSPKARPVTVGTWFSLGHSTIVIITSIVVAATAAGVSKKFDGFGQVGGIIGSSVSAAFLIILGIMNAYILYKLVLQLRKILAMPLGHEASPAAFKVEGGGPLFRVLKRMFKLIDRPWKMYPLGVLFGLGFDTSSEVALLGISSIQASKGTSIWLIMVFPILFTAGMCLIDTIDGALMLAIYVGPMDRFGVPGKKEEEEEEERRAALVDLGSGENGNGNPDLNEHDLSPPRTANPRAKDPIAFLYYSIVLTTLTVIVAMVIGTIQLLTMILNVANPSGPFWDGVATAGDNYEIIGGSICASFVIFGGFSVLVYKPWRRRVDEKRRLRDELEEGVERGEVHEQVEFNNLDSDDLGPRREDAKEASVTAKDTYIGRGPSGGIDDRIDAHVERI